MSEVPIEFILYGGTAVALRLGHRASVDFDFFAALEFDADTIYESIGFLNESMVVQKSANTLTCIVDRSGPVQCSFFGVPKLKKVGNPDRIESNGLQVASMIDLAGTKAAVVQKRAEAKDYFDLDAMIVSGEVDLSQALAAAKRIYGSVFNPQITLKALSYFDDGNLATLGSGVRERLAAAVKRVDLNQLPIL